MASDTSALAVRSPGLVDVLDRILDKGLVIAGDIKVCVANVELLTLQIRLLVCSIDKAEEIGVNWWRYDRNISPAPAKRSIEDEEVRARLADLECAVKRLRSSKRKKSVRRKTIKEV